MSVKKKIVTFMASEDKLYVLKIKSRQIFQVFINPLLYERWGGNSYIVKSGRILGKKHISIGKNVSILEGARVEAITKWGNVNYSPHIEIGDNVRIGQNLHLMCAESVVIEEGVSITPDVVIVDINHQYYDVGSNIMEQPIDVHPIKIEKDAFIGAHAIIFGGVTIGSHAVIGAGSVVTHDVPAYSVAVGRPAKVIKKYDFEQRKWIRI